MTDPKTFLPKNSADVGGNELLEFIKNHQNENGEILTIKKGGEIKRNRLFPRSHLVAETKTYCVVRGANIQLQGEEKWLRFNDIMQPDIGIIFLDCKIPKLSIHRSKFSDVIFFNCEIDGPISADYSTIGHIYLDNLKIGNLKFATCEINGLHLGNSNLGNLEMIDSAFHLLKMDKCEASYWRLVNSSLKLANFNNCNTSYFFIAENSQIGDLIIKNSTVKAIEVSKNYMSLSLLNAIVPFIEIEDCTLSFFKIGTGTKSEINLKQCFINLLDLEKVVVGKDTVMNCIDSSFYTISIVESYILGQLLFKNLKTSASYQSFPTQRPFTFPSQVENKSSAIVKSVYEHRKETFKSIQETYLDHAEKLELLHGSTACILLINSSLGKTEIIGSDLRLSRIKYLNTNLLDSFWAGTKLPTLIHIYELTDTQPEYYHQKVDFFSQMKKIYDRQGDSVKVLELNAKMLSSQQQYLKYTLKNLSWRRRYFSDEWFGYITFCLNDLSNKHGESWQRALGFILLVALVLFFPFVWSLKYQFDASEIFKLSGYSFLLDITYVSQHFNIFPVFLNPARTLDFMSKLSGQPTPGAHYFWDFISRIFIGYGIFQFIIAFRRHGKAS